MGLLSQCQGPQKVHICHLQTLFYRPFYIPWSLPEVSKNAPVWFFQTCIDQKSMIYFLENAFVCNCMNKGFSWLRILFFYMTTSFKKADKNSFWSICIDGITFEKDIMGQNLAENNRLGACAWLTLYVPLRRLDDEVCRLRHCLNISWSLMGLISIAHYYTLMYVICWFWSNIVHTRYNPSHLLSFYS